MKIFFIEGPEIGKTHESESDNICLGRSPECDIHVKDVLVSQKP